MMIKKSIYFGGTPFIKVVLALAFGWVLFVPISCLANSQVFPPENASECGADNYLTWQGNGSSVRCSSVSSGLPDGVVLPFALDSCPPGWQPYAPANGRVVVGYDPTTPGAVGSVGGAKSVQLSIENMPRHSHPIRITNGIDDYSLASVWTGDVRKQGIVEWDWSTPDNSQNNSIYDPKNVHHMLLSANGDGAGPFTSAGYAGGSPQVGPNLGVPFDARMPYITLLYCVKNTEGSGN